MTVGRALRRLREQQGVSQEALARRAGTSQAAVSDIERGRVSPTFDTAERLFLCLGHQLRVEATPLEMDADLDSLRELQLLTPQQRLQRMSQAAEFLRRGRQALEDGRSVTSER